MKKIINGKRYDTDTAKECGTAYSKLGRRDFGYWEETLYQKRTGEFFLYGEGGPASRYAVSAGQNSWSGGEKIIPLSAQNAMMWAEEHLEADEYERIFGEVTEDESKKVVTYSLPVSTIEKVKRIAAEQGISLSEVIERAISAL